MNNRILVIDDMQSIQADYLSVLSASPTTSPADQLAADILGGTAEQTPSPVSFKVDVASQGEEGLLRVKQSCADHEPYAMVFVDVRMPPGWDGIETIKRIWRVDPDVQVAIVTAYSDYSWERINQELGTTDQLLVLKKPFEMIEVLQIASALTSKWNIMQALRDAKARYLDFYDHAPDMYVSVVAETALIRDCNQTLIHNIGYSREEIIGAPIFQLYHPDCMDRVQASFKSFVETGEVHNAELQLKKKDGGVIDVNLNVTAIRDDNDKVLYSRSCWIDISARKQAERVARHYAQAMQQSGEGIIIANTDGVIEHVNRAFCKITGYSEAEAIGANANILKSGNQDAAFYQDMWSTIRRGDTWLGKVINKKKNGEFYPAMLTISPIQDEYGHINQYIGIQQNLQKYQELEAQLQQAQKMEAIGTLVGGIAHDFNNTLAAITGNLYLAKFAAGEQPELLDRLDQIETLSFRAAATIQQLLAFSRKGIVRKHSISVPSLLRETMKLVQVSLPENIDLSFQLHGGEMKINGDINQLQQVLMNLINNACDALEETQNPKLTIQLDRVVPDQGLIESYEELAQGEFAHIVVADNGEGIDDTHLQHIFEPFFTTKEVGKGTGLGLSMVYGMVKTHAGVITVESSSNEPLGTTFHIYLPLLGAVQKMVAAVQHAPVQQGHGETILLVDDDKAVLETGRDVLQGLGYQVLIAEDGLIAVEIYEQNPDVIDLLILDVVMPRVSGPDALLRIKKINPKVKAIFTTGYDKTSSQALKACVIEETVISKPFTVNELSQSIFHLLNQSVD